MAVVRRVRPAAEVQSVDRALRILNMFEGDGTAVRLIDVARTLSIAKSTAHRLLTTLELHGYVWFDEAARVYHLGLGAVRLGQRALAGIDLRRAALPHLRRLTRATGETSFLLAVRGDRAVILESTTGGQTLQLTLPIGDPWPLHAGASNLILLAFLPPQEIDEYLARPLERYTGRTEVDPERLRRRVAAIRRQGYAFTVGELSENIGAVAVPILDGDVLLGGLCVAGISHNFPESRVPELVALLRAAAGEIARELGAEGMGR